MKKLGVPTEIIVKDTSYEQFENDFRTNFAAVRALEIIGEAVKRLPQAKRKEFGNEVKVFLEFNEFDTYRQSLVQLLTNY